MRLTMLLAAIVAAAGCLSLPGTPGTSDLALRPAKTPAASPPVLHCQSPDIDQPRLIQALESQRQAISAELGLPAEAPPLNIFVFATQAAYETHVATKFPGFPARRAIFVHDAQESAVYAYLNPQLDVDLRHEATHGYLHAVLPGLPLWLDEGLAEYYEVAAAQRGRNYPHIELLQTQQAVGGWTPNLSTLEQLDDAGAMTQLEYAESWLWVHFFLQTPGPVKELFLAYLSQLSQGAAPAPLSSQLGRLGPRVRVHLAELSARGE